MAPLPRKLKDLCSPALFYFVLSMIGLVVSAWENMGRKNIYVLGGMPRRVHSTPLVFLMKIVYILFWTWVLNLICKDGHTGISWFLVLIPFILLFTVVALLMVSPYEGMANASPADEKTVKEGLAKKKPMDIMNPQVRATQAS
jgi:H+/Cl- antiporter ClcA